MDLELSDKVAVVTGANKGIGFAVTKALLDEGACVVAGSLTTENLDGLDRVTAVAADLSARAGPRRWCSARSTSTAGSTCW
jgi:NAD(P)-dependent dehydrogenase (short-subunit alcohol dehydrogenase family)